MIAKIESIGIYNSQIAKPNTDISKSRRTEMFELELPLEDGGISYINSEACPITEGIFICAKPNGVRHTKFPFKCYYLHINIQDEYLHELYEALLSLPDFIRIKNRDVYVEIFEEMYKLYSIFTKRDEIMLESLFLKLVYFLCRETEINMDFADKTKGKGFITEALRYIDENITEDLSLERVAGHVLVSPIHFHNCFKYALGKTLRAYIEEKRIKKSINLMQTTDMTLTQIAYNCGFSSQSYFSYTFKRKTGVTPRAYIKNLNNKYEV